MTSGAPPNWSLFAGESVRCADVSLVGLAPSSSRAVRGVIDRLSLIAPLDVAGELPWIHLHHCRTEAKGIVADPAIGLVPASIHRLASTYEAGLLAGFDDLFLSLPDDQVGEFRREALGEIGSIGRRHGSSIRQWWASYSRLVDAWRGRGGA